MKNDNKHSTDVIDFEVEHQPHDVFDSFVKFIQKAPLSTNKKRKAIWQLYDMQFVISSVHHQCVICMTRSYLRISHVNPQYQLGDNEQHQCRWYHECTQNEQ